MWKAERLFAMAAATGSLLVVPCYAEQDVPADTFGASMPDGYRAYSFDRPTTIPDADPAGVKVGPLPVSDESAAIAAIILGIDVAHTHTGDLHIELYLARSDADLAEALFACPAQMDGLQFFRDDLPGAAAIETPVSREFPGGVTTSGEVVTFAAFDGLQGGGSFYLAVADTIAEDAGTIRGWVVYVKEAANATTPSRMATGGM